MRAKLLVICEIVLILVITTKSQDIGQRCTVLKTGGPGVYTKAYGCEKSTQELGDDTACKNEGLTDVVCCPSESVKKFKRISDKKCAEYAPGIYDECGQKSLPMPFSSRQTEIGEFPHTAVVVFDGPDVTCIGSLISDRFVLTVAHCQYRQRRKPKFVRLGHIDRHSKNWKQFKVVEVIQHPSYRKEYVYNDISLLKLDRQVKFGPNIRAACLPLFENEVESSAVITGWGKTWRLGPQVDLLHKATLEIFSYDDCEVWYPNDRMAPNGVDRETQICMGSKIDGNATCTAQLGGILQRTHHCQYCMHTIIGSASFGHDCGSVECPDVYTQIRGHVNWIEGIVWQDS